MLPCPAAAVNEHDSAAIAKARRKKPALQGDSVRSVDRHFLPGGIPLGGYLIRAMRVDLHVLPDEVAVNG